MVVYVYNRKDNSKHDKIECVTKITEKRDTVNIFVGGWVMSLAKRNYKIVAYYYGGK